MRYLHNYTVLLIIMLSPFTFAEDHEIEVSPELLEFLGEWETDDGEWIDPVEMKDDYYTVFTSQQDESINE